MFGVTGDPCVHCDEPATDTFIGSPICESCSPGSDPVGVLETGGETQADSHPSTNEEIGDTDDAGGVPDGQAVEGGGGEGGPTRDEVRAALDDAVGFYHGYINPDRPDVDTDQATEARSYFRERGWTDETIDRFRLGYAPADAPLFQYLKAQGHSAAAIRATGLVWGDDPVWKGRYVFPYFGEDGRGSFAISRASDPHHPDDWAGRGDEDDEPAKYHKIQNTRDDIPLEEPIFGLATLEEWELGEPVFITEGIADAITAIQHGYTCVSPVTTSFKKDDRERLAAALTDAGVGSVYIIQDAERPSSSLTDADNDADLAGWQRFHVGQFGPGTEGGVNTAAFLNEECDDLDVRVGELPRNGLDKVDLDDYLNGWGKGDLEPILRSAKPARQHPAYDAAAEREARRLGESGETTRTGGVTFDAPREALDGLWGLTMEDVAGHSPGYRGKNPLGHHAGDGGSTDYFVIIDEETAYDHKYRVTYNPTTFLLCRAGARTPQNPGGQLSDREVFTAWQFAATEGIVDVETGTVPTRALAHVAVEHDLVDDRDETRTDNGVWLPDEVWRAALTTVREEYGIDVCTPRAPSEADVGGGSEYPVEECEPRIVDRESFDIKERRRAMTEERYTAFLDADTLTVWGDKAGTGKTTTTARTAASFNRPHAMMFRNHRKARDFICDEPTPEGYFHLKGGPQKRNAACMDVDHDDEDCPTHGHPSNCPAMCPVYDLDAEDNHRQQYEAIARELGQRRAHTLLGDELPGHDEDGNCAWLEQFDPASRADRIVGVHDYQTLQTLQRVKDGPERDVIVDETPRSLKNDRRLSVADLTALANALADVGEGDEALTALATFAEDVLAVVSGAPTAPSTLADLEPPTVPDEATATREVEVDPSDLPAGVDPDDVVTKTWREDVGMPEEGYRSHRCHVIERPQVAETFARAKLIYNETVVERMRGGRWSGEPMAVDALLAAAAEATDAEAEDGETDTEIRDGFLRAISAPELLDGTCPRCGSIVDEINGMRCCASDDGCGWDEEHGHLTCGSTPIARAGAHTLTVDGDDGVQSADQARLVLEQYPQTSELPDRPLLLDATATPAKVASFYGVDEDEVRVEGDEPLDMPNLHTTQVLDGQYHASTIRQGETAQERIQQTITHTAKRHEHPLYIGKKALLSLFNFPDDAEVVHYHAIRGLNFNECDAVVCIGAPHPDVGALQRDAELLARGRDVDAGGVEHSTRPDVPNPPVYRKLDYSDDDGCGRAVPTKHYSGLVGDLFREGREKELVQGIHRIRGLLAEEPKHAYLLTNVPTSLQIDEVCSFGELADPVEALLPVAEGAIKLAEHVEAAVTGREAPDGFRPGNLVERVGGTCNTDGTARFRVAEFHRIAQFHGIDVCENTVRRWVDDLQTLGLLVPGQYRQRQGVPYTADSATLTWALSVLHYNDGVKVAVKRRIRALAKESVSGLAWLQAAREAFDLRGAPDGATHPPTPPE